MPQIIPQLIPINICKTAPILMATALLLTSCALGPGINHRQTAEDLATQQCINITEAKGKKFSEWVDCYTGEIRNYYTQNNLGINKGYGLILRKLELLAPKVDKGTMTADEALFEVNAFSYQLEQQNEMLRQTRRAADNVRMNSGIFWGRPSPWGWGLGHRW